MYLLAVETPFLPYVACNGANSTLLEILNSSKSQNVVNIDLHSKLL